MVRKLPQEHIEENQTGVSPTAPLIGKIHKVLTAASIAASSACSLSADKDHRFETDKDTYIITDSLNDTDSTLSETSDTHLDTGIEAPHIYKVVPPPPAPKWKVISKERVEVLTPNIPNYCEVPPGMEHSCEWYGPSLGDFDQDGKMEVIWHQYIDEDGTLDPIDEISHTGPNGRPVLVPNDEGFRRMQDFNPALEVGYQKVGVMGIADSDGDGDQDIFYTGRLSSNNGIQFLSRNEGNGVYSAFMTPPSAYDIESNPFIVELDDWDNDGRLDMIHNQGAHDETALANNITFQVLLQKDDGNYWTLPWVEVNEGMVTEPRQLQRRTVNGRPMLIYPGTSSQPGISTHTMLYEIDDTVNVNGIPMAIQVSGSTPGSNDGAHMGGDIIEMITDNGQGPEWSSFLATTIDSRFLNLYKEFGGGWYRTSNAFNIPFSPSTYAAPGTNPDAQLPWIIHHLDDHTFCIANGDDAGSGTSYNGSPNNPQFYFGRDQIVDCYVRGVNGAYSLVTPQMEIAGFGSNPNTFIGGQDGQPGGSYISFYQRSLPTGESYGVWVGSWPSLINWNERIMMSWVMERVRQEDHKWITFAPQGTTSNASAIGAEIFYTSDPVCLEDLHTLLENNASPDEFARACDAFGYTRQLVGSPDAGSIVLSPEVEFYMGPVVNGVKPKGHALIRYPSGQLQRLEDLESGWYTPIEPETVTIYNFPPTQTITGGGSNPNIRFIQKDAYGTPRPIHAFNETDIQTFGVPVNFTVSTTSAGIVEIEITPPTQQTIDDWVSVDILHRIPSTQFRIRGTEHRPRLDWE